MSAPLAQDDQKPRRHLLPIGEVADWLGVEIRHVRRLVAERRIPYIKWGHLLRFDPDEVQAWIDRYRCSEGGRGAPPIATASPVRSVARRRSASTAPQGQQPFLLPLQNRTGPAAHE